MSSPDRQIIGTDAFAHCTGILFAIPFEPFETPDLSTDTLGAGASVQSYEIEGLGVVDLNPSARTVGMYHHAFGPKDYSAVAQYQTFTETETTYPVSLRYYTAKASGKIQIEHGQDPIAYVNEQPVACIHKGMLYVEDQGAWRAQQQLTPITIEKPVLTSLGRGDVLRRAYAVMTLLPYMQYAFQEAAVNAIGTLEIIS